MADDDLFVVRRLRAPEFRGNRAIYAWWSLGTARGRCRRALAGQSTARRFVRKGGSAHRKDVAYEDGLFAALSDELVAILFGNLARLQLKTPHTVLDDLYAANEHVGALAASCRRMDVVLHTIAKKVAIERLARRALPSFPLPSLLQGIPDAFTRQVDREAKAARQIHVVKALSSASLYLATSRRPHQLFNSVSCLRRQHETRHARVAVVSPLLREEQYTTSCATPSGDFVFVRIYNAGSDAEAGELYFKRYGIGKGSGAEERDTTFAETANGSLPTPVPDADDPEAWDPYQFLTKIACSDDGDRMAALVLQPVDAQDDDPPGFGRRVAVWHVGADAWTIVPLLQSACQPTAAWFVGSSLWVTWAIDNSVPAAEPPDDDPLYAPMAEFTRYEFDQDFKAHLCSRADCTIYGRVLDVVPRPAGEHPMVVVETAKCQTEEGVEEVRTLAVDFPAADTEEYGMRNISSIEHLVNLPPRGVTSDRLRGFGVSPDGSTAIAIWWTTWTRTMLAVYENCSSATTFFDCGNEEPLHKVDVSAWIGSAGRPDPPRTRGLAHCYLRDWFDPVNPLFYRIVYSPCGSFAVVDCSTFEKVVHGQAWGMTQTVHVDLRSRYAQELRVSPLDMGIHPSQCELHWTERGLYVQRAGQLYACLSA